MVAAENGAFEFQRLQQLFHLDEESLLVHCSPLRKILTESLLALRKTHHQRGRKFRLRQVEQARRIFCVLF